VTNQRPPKQDAALGAVGQLLAFALAAVAAAVIAPALLAGMALAYALRRARLRFTWALPATAVLAVPLILAPGHTLPAVVAVARDVPHGQLSLAATVASLWGWWLPLAGLVAGVVGARLDRRDRLHGGQAERRARAALGPAGLATRTLARRRAITVRDPAQIVLGRDARGHPVLVPSLRAHAMIVGGSDTGKTTTAARLIDGEIANGRGCVILDGKGGRHLPYVALALARRYHRPLALWSVLPYGDPELDSRRWRWNPAGGGNATEIKDRVVHAETQTEPH
jgi:Type IV secretion-system coupling protein DNA-binding domain